MDHVQGFEHWAPFVDEPTRIVIDGLADSGDDAFQLLLRSLDAPAERLLLRWLQRPLAYRNIDESYRARLWATFPTRGHAFWVVRESEWIRELHWQSGGVTEGLHLVHYGVYTDDDCVDVISAVPPTAERLPL